MLILISGTLMVPTRMPLMLCFVAYPNMTLRTSRIFKGQSNMGYSKGDFKNYRILFNNSLVKDYSKILDCVDNWIGSNLDLKIQMIRTHLSIDYDQEDYLLNAVKKHLRLLKELKRKTIIWSQRLETKINIPNHNVVCPTFNMKKSLAHL